MIKDDILVFDCVAHPFNFDPSNVIDLPGELFRQHLFAFHNVLTPENEPKLSAEEFFKEWSTEEISRMGFDESDTDMLVAMPLPLTDHFHDGLSPGNDAPSCEIRTGTVRSSGAQSTLRRERRLWIRWRCR